MTNPPGTTLPVPSTPPSPYRGILDMACDAQMGYRMPVDVRNAIIGELDLEDGEGEAK